MIMTGASQTGGRMQPEWRIGEKIAEFTLPGEPSATGNSREIIMIGGRPRLRKGDKALAFEALAALYVPALDAPFEGDVAVVARVFYASRRPDLDSSLVRDALEGRVIKNDRQVRHVSESGFIDKARPRVEVAVYKAEAVLSAAPYTWGAT
jgi:Holliday junction resolvase RusA-like endonuclease